MLINGLATASVCFLLFAIIFVDKFRFRFKTWDVITLSANSVFVAYMFGALVGNSHLSTTPFFMIFVGLMVSEMLNKKSLFEAERIVLEEKKQK